MLYCNVVIASTNAQLPLYSHTPSLSPSHAQLLHSAFLTPILDQLRCFSSLTSSLTMSSLVAERASPTPSELVARTESPAPLDASSDSSSSGSYLSFERSAHLPTPPPPSPELELPGGQSPRAFEP